MPKIQKLYSSHFIYQNRFDNKFFNKNIMIYLYFTYIYYDSQFVIYYNLSKYFNYIY